jgi:hypothetical protein
VFLSAVSGVVGLNTESSNHSIQSPRYKRFHCDAVFCLRVCVFQVYTSAVGCALASVCTSTIPASVTALGAAQQSTAWCDATARLTVTCTQPSAHSAGSVGQRDAVLDAAVLTLTVYRKQRGPALLQFAINCV